MKKIILLFGLLISANSLFAQQDSLLKNFKFRVNNFRAIGFNVTGGSKFENPEFSGVIHKNSSSGGALGVTYYSTRSTDKILLTAFAGVYVSLSSAKSSSPTEINKSRNISSAPWLNILNKWFSHKMFTELGADISSNLYSNKEVSSIYPASSISKQAQYSIGINLGIGKGRLENITDMQNALWLSKTLTAAGRIQGTLSAEDINGLGQSITKGNNTRVLDARKRAQFLLTTVDSFLQQKGLINKTDISYFSNLNDILFFAFNNSRFAGTEKYIRLTPAITGWNNNDAQNNGIDKFKHRFNTQSLTLSPGFKKYIPSSLIHQNNYGAAVKLSYTFTDLADRYFINNVVSNEKIKKTDLKQAGMSLFYEHGIYPNTRTALTFNLQSEAGYQDVGGSAGFYSLANLSSNFSYFISYHSRFSLTTGIDYQKNLITLYQYLEQRPNNLRLYINGGLEINL